jgi:hypothetical protein
MNPIVFYGLSIYWLSMALSFLSLGTLKITMVQYIYTRAISVSQELRESIRNTLQDRLYLYLPFYGVVDLWRLTLNAKFVSYILKNFR